MLRGLILSLAGLWRSLVYRLIGRRLRFPWLEIEIRGSLPESGDGFDLLGYLMGRRQTEVSLLDLLTVLRAAARDENLRAVLISIGNLECGFARIEEIAVAISEVREAGKRIVVVAEHLGLKEYRLACEADRIVLAPQGGLSIAGTGADVTFFRGLLDKFGIEPQLLHRGDYKSASELLTEKSISTPHRKMLDELLGDLFRQLATAVALRRGLGTEVALRILGDGPYTASRALEMRLVDALGHAPDERERIRLELATTDTITAGQGNEIKGAGYGQYLRLAALRARQEIRSPDGVALLHIEGTITSGEGIRDAREARSTGSKSVVRAVEAIRKSRRIKALVLRVNSPGGSGLASDVMLAALSRLEIPVVISMGDVAASGGYYVAANRKFRIYAGAGTITGSIGVIAGKIALAGLYEKLGLGHAHVGHGTNSNYFSAHTPWTPEQLTRTERDIDEFYRDFVGKVAEARGRTFEEIHEVAQGRVWTGAQARERGLVDEVGGLRAALNTARTLAGLPDGAIRIFSRFQRRPRLPLRLAVEFPDEPVAGLLPELKIWNSLAHDRLLALMPWRLRIY